MLRILTHSTRAGASMARCGLQLERPALGDRTGVIDTTVTRLHKEYNILGVNDSNEFCPTCDWVATHAKPPPLLSASRVAV